MGARDKHFALIVGVSRYQEEGLETLEGATRNAKAFHDWVISPSGGDVLERNVVLLENPGILAIEEGFRRFCAPAATNGSAGERLYVYLSGHGVAQDVHEASLLAADGGLNARDKHVPGWSWLSWFLQSGYFDEVVLFADCCRTMRGHWAVRRFPLDPVIRVVPKEVRWVRGFAVQFGGIAIEEQVGRERRGVFTHALLDALEHARIPDKQDPARWSVTASSVRDYLFNSPHLVEWRDYQAPSILVEREVVFTTGSDAAQRTTPVVVEAGDGGPPVIAGGPSRPDPWPVEPGPEASQFQVHLPRGIYVARAGRRSKVFEVLGDLAPIGPLALEERKEWPSSPTTRVVLRGPRAASEVYLIDSTFQLRERGLQHLEVPVEPGVYKARFQLGSELEDQCFEVRDGERIEVDGRPLEVECVTPLRGTRGVTEPEVIWSAAARPEGEGAGVLTVLLRGGGEIAPSRLALTLQGAGRSRRLPWRETGGWQMASLRLPAGIHVLSISGRGSRLCRAVPVIAGRQTALSLREPPERDEGDRRLGTLLHGELILAPFPIAGDEDELLRQVIAQQVLGRSRALEWPQGKQEEASLSAWTLLLRTHGVLEARRSHDSHALDVLRLQEKEREQVKSAYDRLQGTELAGLADVEALSLALGTGQSTRPVDLDIPPLLASTWRTLVTASLTQGGVRGHAPALRMAEGMMASSLWVTWAERATVERLDGEAQALLAPELRPGAGGGTRPSWVETRSVPALARDRADTLASGLQLPLPLIQELIQNMRDDRVTARRARAGRRLAALQDKKARICLVVLPDGVRVDPTHGQPIDFDAVVEELVNDAAEQTGLVAVRAPPVDVNLSEEMQEALAQADVLLVDGTFDSPVVTSAATLFRATRRGPGRTPPVVRIQAEGHQAGMAPGPEQPFLYQATYGTGLSFLDPAAFQQALAAAAANGTRPTVKGKRRTEWLQALARTEQRREALHDLAVAVTDLVARENRGEATRRDVLEALRRALPPGSLRGASASVQLDTFLVCRSAYSWEDMERCYQEMDVALQQSPLVREQLALGWKWSGTDGVDKAAQTLLGVIDQIGRNGETCGLLGGLFKKAWWDQRRKGLDNQAAFRDALTWYRAGLTASPMDPYPGVNLLTLLAFLGTDAAMAEHAERLKQVELAVTPRLHHRPNYWDLATMMELAANMQNKDACEWFLRRALAAPHDPWQAGTTAVNLEILCDSPVARFKDAAEWLKPFVAKLKANSAR